LTYTAGTQLQVRLQVTGTTSTTVRARVWKVGDTEPTTWRVSNIDTTTTALQAAGYIGVQSYVSGTATSTPVTVKFDDLNAIPAV
jgi:hypothetical protein